MAIVTTAGTVVGALGGASGIAGLVGAGTALYGAVRGSGGGPKAPPPRNIANELSTIQGQYNNFLSGMTNGTGNLQQTGLGNLHTLTQNSFDQNAFFRDNPDAKAAWDSERAAGGLQGWTPAQFASAYVGGGDISLDSNGGAPLAKWQQADGVGNSFNQLNSQNRISNLNDVSNLSSQYADIIRGNNQPYYNQLGSFTSEANGQVQQSAPQIQAANQAQNGYGAFNYNASPLQQGLNAYGMQALMNGGNLSPSELRNVQQASRAGFAARGLDGTNASVVDEAMQTDAANRNRLLSNLGIASNAQNQGFNDYATQLSGYGANLQNQNSQQAALMGSANLAEAQRQSRMNAMGQATSLQAQGRIDPYAAILGGTNDQSGGLLGFYNTNQNTQNSLLGGLLNYGSDLNNTNYNANAAANIAGYNGQQALNGSLIGMGGNLLGSYLGNQGSYLGNQVGGKPKPGDGTVF